MAQTLQKNKIIIRPPEETDMAFICNSWSKGVRFGLSSPDKCQHVDLMREIPLDIFIPAYRDFINAIIERRYTLIQIACLEDDLDVILGYSVSEPAVMHWIFVKDVWRNQGIGKMLYPEGITHCTNLTLIGRSLKNKLKLIYNPFL